MTTTPHNLVARLGPDLNWWLEPDPGTDEPTPPPRGILDPRQVRALTEHFRDYQSHGLRLRQFNDAFRPYALAGELGEGLVRLEAVRASLLDDPELFAWPVREADGEGPYADFLDALVAARVRQLNATHQYARNCVVEDLREELDSLDHDRYFSTEAIHPFDELTEILDWHPADWDEP